MDTGEIQKEKKRERCYEQLYDRKFNNLEEMNNFLETYILPKLNQEIDQLNRPITRHEIEYVIKTHPIKKKSGTRWLHRQILPNIQRRIYTNPSQIPLKFQKGVNTLEDIL